MRKLLALASCLISLSFPVFAAEPANINVHKEKLHKYYDSGEYDKDIEKVISSAHEYLKKQLSCCKEKLMCCTAAEKKPAIVLDIDETALSNYKNMRDLGFGGNKQLFSEAEDRADAPAILPTLKLYEFAKKNNVAVFFVTGRPESKTKRASTVKNLKKAGYDNWDRLILRPQQYRHKPAGLFKTAARKKLEEQGYNIILNIGDQCSDLVGSYAQKGFKLPNPYYYIP